MAPWTDLPTILSSPEGRAALYGYLKSMDSGDPSPRRRQRYIELLEEVDLFKQQADDTQKRADHILTTYVNSDRSLGGLAGAAPSDKELEDLNLREVSGVFVGLEAAVREQLSPVVPQFLRDVEKGDKSVRQRVKESGYKEFMDRLHGSAKRKGHCTGTGGCALC